MKLIRSILIHPYRHCGDEEKSRKTECTKTLSRAYEICEYKLQINNGEKPSEKYIIHTEVCFKNSTTLTEKILNEKDNFED